LHPLKNARFNCFTVALQGIVDLGVFRKITKSKMSR